MMKVKFRAEVVSDLGEVFVHWAGHRIVGVRSQQIMDGFPDHEAEIDLADDVPLDQLKAELAQGTDCHVMTRTLALAEDYKSDWLPDK